MSDQPQYVCAHCGSGKGLYRSVSVPGWQSIKVVNIDGRLTPHMDGDSDIDDWNQAECEGYGCGECQHQSSVLSDLVVEGLRDCPKCEGAGCPRCGYAGRITISEPVIAIHPEQQRLTA